MTATKTATITQKRLYDIKDIKLQNSFKSFIEFKCKDCSKAKASDTVYYYSHLPEILKDYALDELDWDDFQDIVEKNNEEIKAISDFLVFLISENLYMGLKKAKISDLKDFLCGESAKSLSTIVFNKDENIDYFYTKKMGKHFKLLRIPVENGFLRKLIKDFLLQSNHSKTITDKEFCNKFIESLNGKDIFSLKEFNYDIFKTQFDYYIGFDKEGKPPRTLISFYLYLLSLPGGEIIFSGNDPVDKFFLCRNSFIKEYLIGFRIIKYNRLDELPENDRWLMYPEGFLNKSYAKIGIDAKAIDFTLVNDSEKRYWVKHWFWNSAKELQAGRQMLQPTAEFLNFCEKIKRENVDILSAAKTDKNYDIKSDHIALYRNSLSHTGKKNNPKTILGKISLLRLFIKHIEKYKLATVDPYCYNFLKLHGFYYKNNSKPLSNEDMGRLLKEMLRQAQNGSVDDFIYYAMVYLQVFTEMRASHIRAIRIDAIKTDLKNKYSIVMPTKTSGGQPKKIQITRNTKKLLDDIILRTQETRDLCKDPTIRDLLFIHHNRKNVIRNMSDVTFRTHVKKTAAKIGIECSPENLRDTYMTSAMESEIAGNINAFERRVLTGHASSRIDDRHYAKVSIGKIMEAFHNIIIGNIDLHGKVIKEIKSSVNIPENQVSNKCGLCDAKTCTLQNNLDCLMCDNFVTSKEFIGAFNLEIERLNNMIKNHQLGHEREHLLQIKKLCVAYLEKIMMVCEVNIYEV